MRLAEGLHLYLTGYAPLNALIGSRVYPLHLPQNPILPAIGFFQVARRPFFVKPGVTNAIVDVLIQFDVYALSYLQGIEVARQLKTALYGYRASDPRVYDARVEGEHDVDIYDEQELQQWRRIVEANIWYAEE